MLRVSGFPSDPESPREAYDVVIDDRGELSVVLLSRESGTPAANVHAALSRVRSALASHAPIYEVVAALKAWCEDPEHQAVFGVTLLRFGQPDSRVEILTAGNPAVVSAAPGGRVAVHGPLSPAVGARPREVHPYELSPLVWGSVWVVQSLGLTAGSLDPEAARKAVIDNELPQAGAALAGAAPHEIRSALPRIADDGSLLLVHADPTRRFESGIR